MHRRFFLVLLNLLIPPCLSAQAGALDNMFQIPHPPAPPVMSALSLMGGGKMVTDPSLPLKGPVARVSYKEFNLFSGTTPPPVSRDLSMEFDEQGRQVREVENRGATQSRTTTTYQGGRMATREFQTVRDGKPTGEPMVDRWAYDSRGRLIDFQRKRGDQSQNHYTNITYDAEGRPLTSEYHQGPGDQLQSRVEYQYSADGKKITAVTYDQSAEKLALRTTILDEKGRAVGFDFSERDWKTHQMKKPRRLSFSYDERGRLTEQDADEDPAAQQDEQSIPDGKVRITYDDATGTRHIAYEGGGSRIASATRLDENDAILAITFSASGQPNPPSAEFVCVYDAHGNWTECKRWATQGSERKVTGSWQRTITYR
jgi:hypothetical protein